MGKAADTDHRMHVLRFTVLIVLGATLAYCAGRFLLGVFAVDGDSTHYVNHTVHVIGLSMSLPVARIVGSVVMLAALGVLGFGVASVASCLRGARSRQ